MVYKINNVTLDGLSLKEAKKLLESSKDKADIVVKRDPYKAQNPASQTTRPASTPNKTEQNNAEEHRNNLTANQNLYVPPPTRRDEKNTLARADQLLREETNNASPP